MSTESAAAIGRLPPDAAAFLSTCIYEAVAALMGIYDTRLVVAHFSRRRRCGPGDAFCKENGVQISMKPLVLALLGSAAFTVPACCMACSLAPSDPLLLKKAMLKEIAFRLGISVEQISLDGITAPESHRPLELGVDCSGLAAWHHSSGFRVAVATQQHAFATMAKPHTAAGAVARYRARVSSGFYSGRDAAVSRDIARVPKPKPLPQVDYSADVRWPQYPGEAQFVQSYPFPPAGQRWPQFPHESPFQGQAPGPFPMRWSTLGVLPAKPSGQGFCRYEGVAVVLGHDSSSPVAVNFQQHCD